MRPGGAAAGKAQNFPTPEIRSTSTIRLCPRHHHFNRFPRRCGSATAPTPPPTLAGAQAGRALSTSNDALPKTPRTFAAEPLATIADDVSQLLTCGRNDAQALDRASTSNDTSSRLRGRGDRRRLCARSAANDSDMSLAAEVRTSAISLVVGTGLGPWRCRRRPSHLAPRRPSCSAAACCRASALAPSLSCSRTAAMGCFRGLQQQRQRRRRRRRWRQGCCC